MVEILKSIPIEIICAVIAFLGTVMSALIALLTAKHTSKKEFIKMQMQWQREDKLANDQAYADMLSAVSKYLQSGWSKHQRKALVKISTVQMYCSNAELDSLYSSVASGNIESVKAQYHLVSKLFHSSKNSQ